VTPRRDATPPLLRIVEVPKPREFDRDVLGLNREYRLAPTVPAFARVSRGGPMLQMTARPGIIRQPRGWRDMEVSDPFGNRLVFTEAMPEAG